ncbi:MAG TPA: hypothetical protein VJX67_24150 [Blastocatellia bacterium]|nr:hypothetical protein [Blastocatellia bacterium]
MNNYSVCFPDGWRVYQDKTLDRVSGCNRKNGNCTGNGGGFPYPGVVFIFVLPAKSVPNHPPYRDVTDIVSSVPHAGAPPPPITEVSLSGPLSGTAKCLLARMLMFDEVWNDVYGLDIDKTLFRAWAQYNNELPKVEHYRSTIVQILSSISLRKPRDR